MITALILFVALGVLGWGLYRALPFGMPGILAWLQSAVLMAPWLIFFGLFAVGIYLNLIVVLGLLVVSTAIYILLGYRLRAMGKDAATLKRLASLSTSAPADTPDRSTVTVEASSEPTSTSATQSAPPTEAPKIPDDDLRAIQTIFGSDTFFATETIPYQDGAIIKGNLRGDPVDTHQRLSTRLKDLLGDRYRLFLINGPDDKPTIVILPEANDPKPTTIPQKILAGVLAIATLITSFETAGFFQGFDLFANPERIGECVPLASGLILVLAAHEISHRVVAARYQVRLSPPFFIPTWQIGSFGALTRFDSLLPNRIALFDIAFAGPAAGGVISLILLMSGLLLSHQDSAFRLPAYFFQGSVLVGTLARVVLGTALQQPEVSIHPLVVMGWLGLVITALNLMPAGQLDGGRIVQSIYGRKVAGRTTLATLILLGIAALVNPLALYWALIIVIVQRDLERPALNELPEPDDARAALGLLVLFLMAAILLPLTPGLAGRLGIGG